MQMGLGYRIRSPRRKWWVMIFVWMGIVSLFMLAEGASEDQMGVPETGILCISDCATCPVICSPPPPATQTHSPPSQPRETHPPPSPPVRHSPPQSYYYSPSPPPPPVPSPPSPEPSSYSVGSTPPPPFKYYYPPSSQQRTPPGQGPHDYPYPYYYFYASDASYLSFQVALLPPLLFFHVLCLCFR